MYIDYFPKMFSDKTGNEKVDQMKDKMKHALNAMDVNKLKDLVNSASTEEDLKDLLKQEVNFCNQRIEIITL